MITYLARRILWIIPVLFTVSIITFMLMHAVPGGPWDREKRLPAAVEDRLNAKYGLDQPIYIQYVSWAGKFIQGDLGPSYRFADRTVNDIVSDGIWTTVQLGVMAFLLAVIVGIPLGIFAALGHNRWPDYLSTSVSIVGISTPSFVLAILLVVFFGVELKWFPTGGWKGPAILGPADRRPGRLPDRADRPVHPRLDARGDAQGLHPDGPEQGPSRTGRGHPPHGPQRAHPGGHDPRADPRLPGDRLLHHRDHLRASPASAGTTSRRSGPATMAC